jgi:malate permease and related proteins
MGIVVMRFLPDALPRFLGRSLYWFGIPIEIFALARQSDLGHQVGLAPLITIATLVCALGVGFCILQIIKQGELLTPEKLAEKSAQQLEPELPLENRSFAALMQSRARQGSFLISSMLGNTGFVGLAITPAFISPENQSWLVLYSVTQNVVGTYGIGVFVSSYFGRPDEKNHWWLQLRDVLTVPSIWGFVLGMTTRSLPFPNLVESGLRSSVGIVIAAALLLMGMRLSQLRGWRSLKLAIVPSVLKVVVMPLFLGIALVLMRFPAEPRLALVLMAGMPSAFAGLILAEEYELDRELIASCIVLTTVALLVLLPLWLWLFG